MVASGWYFLDLEVYRYGGLAWLRGIPLYVDFPGPLDGPRFPFTYPPIAAVLFSGLNALPLWAVNALVMMAGFTALTAVCVIVVGRLRPSLMWTLGPAVAIAGLALEPVMSTLAFGQINLVLMAMIVIDCLVVLDRRLRGVLIGVAAAIKLTPAMFVLYFLVKRDWRAALTSVATFAGLAVAGFLLAPKDSVEYWFNALLDPKRIGGLALATNQSFRGILHRLSPDPATETLLWLSLSAVAVAVAVYVAWRTRDEFVALFAIAAAGLLASPVSWSHHWVWCVPALLVLGLRTRRWWLAGGVAAVFVTRPFMYMPQYEDREKTWTVLHHIPGDVYVWLAIAMLAVFATRAGSASQVTHRVRQVTDR